MTVGSTNMLKRRSIIKAFNELKQERIIAICAPAGYGKTVAITQWLEREPRAKAVFTLDEHDNNHGGFCERFCAMLRACQPQNKTLTNIVSHPSFQSEPYMFSLRAVSALSTRKKAVIALDDLHLITDNAVLKLLLTFIKRLPKSFQIVLVSRHDLPPIFSELLLKGQVALIDAEQFLFSDEEVKILYNNRGTQITQEQAAKINSKAHGWAIGINAFLLANEASFNNVRDYLDDFVQSNIWERWDEQTRDFMLRTCVLRELTPKLCEAMTGVKNSAKLLKELVQKGAFITQLQDGTYRYHHLFQQFLRRMCEERGEGFLHSLLEAEGNYHLSQGDFYPAVDCFIKCKNHDGIAKCFDLLEASGGVGFEEKRLLPILNNPEMVNVAKRYPHMLYLLAWRAYIAGDIEEVTSLLSGHYERQEATIKNAGTFYDNLFLLVLDTRLSIIQWFGVFDIMPSTLNPSFMRWMFSMHMPTIHRGIRDFSEAAIGDIEENLKQVHLKADWVFGEEAPMLVENIAAELFYEQGKLENAREHAIEAMAKMKSKFFADSKFCVMVRMVCVLDTSESKESNAKEAAALIKSINLMIEDANAYHLLRNFNAFTTRREIDAGNTKAAEEWLKAQDHDDSTLYGIYADFTTCRAAIATGRYDSAMILLKKILTMVSAYNRPLDIIEARILLSIILWRRRLQKESLKCLEEAVLAAMPYGYTQMFVNGGAELAGLLYKLQKRVEQKKADAKQHLEFIKLLNMKMRSSSNLAQPDNIWKKPVRFTEKQKKVMHLLYEGKKQREIAEALGIKLSSLRSHVEAVYNKLEVTNISDAVAKINMLGLFE